MRTADAVNEIALKHIIGKRALKYLMSFRERAPVILTEHFIERSVQRFCPGEPSVNAYIISAKQLVCGGEITADTYFGRVEHAGEKPEGTPCMMHTGSLFVPAAIEEQGITLVTCLSYTTQQASNALEARQHAASPIMDCYITNKAQLERKLKLLYPHHGICEQFAFS